MFKSNVRLFLRNLKRHPIHSALNLACLTIGIAAALFIALYLDFEINYDRFHAQHEHIYRVQTPAVQTREKVMEVNWFTTPANLAPLADEEIPEVQSLVRFFSFFSNTPRLKYDGKEIIATPEHIIATDASVFQVFSFDLSQGQEQDALRGPNKIVISEEMAGRLFGSEDPMGKVVRTRLVHSATNEEAEFALEVSGVFRDLPRNTHLHFEAMISAETDPELDSYYFGRFNTYTYALLPGQVKPETVAAKLTALYDRHLDPKRDPVLVNAQHQLIPLAKIHLSETNGATYLYILGGVGVLLLLIAFISYVNLVTAQAGRRSLEIGMRKVLGSHRTQLVVQFLTESLGFTLLASALAMLLVFLLIKPLNVVLELHITATQLLNMPFLLLILLGTILLGIAGGAYPAFFLSTFRPLVAMKGQLKQSAPLRRYLLSFQFAAVIFVLVGTGMIYRQLRYLQEKDLGFDREYVLRIPLPATQTPEEVAVLKSNLLSHALISSVAASTFIPGMNDMVNSPISVDGSEAQFTRSGRIDYDYLHTMGIKLLTGRNFSPEFQTDAEDHVVVNQAFIKQFELGEHALGAKVRFGGSGNPKYYQIIGVVEDFNQGSLHDAIQAQLFRLAPNGRSLAVKVSGDIPVALQHLEDSWTATYPEQTFDYAFLNDLLADQYREDQRRGSLFLFFSAITVIIAFISLYGLASYLIRQRYKEVGIRKVFGASTTRILILLTRDFLWLVILAAVPGLIAALYITNRWLENFAFRVSTSYILMGGIIFSVFVLTFITVGGHAVRAAWMNPKETLRWE